MDVTSCSFKIRTYFHSCPTRQQPSSASGRVRPAPAVCPSPWRVPAGRRSPSTTVKTDPAGSPTWLRSPVASTQTVHAAALLLKVAESHSFAPSSAGDYEISVKFNEQHIPDSPYLVPVVAPVNDARRLTVAGLQVRHEETPPHPAFSCFLKGHWGTAA